MSPKQSVFRTIFGDSSEFDSDRAILRRCQLTAITALICIAGLYGLLVGYTRITHGGDLNFNAASSVSCWINVQHQIECGDPYLKPPGAGTFPISLAPEYRKLLPIVVPLP